MYIAFIAIIIVVAFIALISLFALKAFQKRRILPTVDRDNSAIEEYFRYLSAITLGAASGESAMEFCKAKSIWDSVTTPQEALAAFQIVDGASRIILEDAKDSFDKEAYEDIERGYQSRKNVMLWAIINNLKASHKSATWNWQEMKEGITESKKRLFVGFYHRIKPYPRPWETE